MHSPSQEFYHKSDHVKSIVNKYDYINLNVIMVTMVIICSKLSQYPYFEINLRCFLAVYPLLMLILK